ncbi:MAG: HAD family phosphatase [Bacteroidetes bacterium]|nr:HAD family phosphatase [Bacteroidota bacterium]
MIKGIRHIILDLGGVILNIDYQATAKAFTELGIRNFPELYSQAVQTSLFDDFETGKIDTPAFIAAMRQLAGIPLGEADIINAWNAMLLDFPLRRLQLLQQLQLHYDMVLLSNTNEIHEAAFNKILNERHGIPNIGVFFDKVYLSHRVGMRKPEVAIFRRILDDTGFDAAKTLFIDDSIQHIEGALKAGLKAIHLEPGMTLEEDIFRPQEGR